MDRVATLATVEFMVDLCCVDNNFEAMGEGVVDVPADTESQYFITIQVQTHTSTSPR